VEVVVSGHVGPMPVWPLWLPSCTALLWYPALCLCLCRGFTDAMESPLHVVLWLGGGAGPMGAVGVGLGGVESSAHRSP
jgi:hypothetical protein